MLNRILGYIKDNGDPNSKPQPKSDVVYTESVNASGTKVQRWDSTSESGSLVIETYPQTIDNKTN